MPPRMNGDYDVWIVGGHHHTSQITADVPKIAPIPAFVSIDLHGI